jgi:hypothetical protein
MVSKEGLEVRCTDKRAIMVRVAPNLQYSGIRVIYIRQDISSIGTINGA